MGALSSSFAWCHSFYGEQRDVGVDLHAYRLRSGVGRTSCTRVLIRAGQGREAAGNIGKGGMEAVWILRLVV